VMRFNLLRVNHWGTNSNMIKIFGLRKFDLSKQP